MDKLQNSPSNKVNNILLLFSIALVFKFLKFTLFLKNSTKYSDAIENI